MNKADYRCIRCGHTEPREIVWRTSQGGVVCADEEMCALRADLQPRLPNAVLSYEELDWLREIRENRQAGSDSESAACLPAC